MSLTMFDVGNSTPCTCGGGGNLNCKITSSTGNCSVSAPTVYLSWSGASGGPIALPWNSGFTVFQTTSNFTIGSNTFGATLSCHQTVSLFYYWLQIFNIGGIGGQCYWIGSANQFAGDSTCSPFHLHGVVSSGTGACSVLTSNGVTDVYVDP